MIFSQSKGKTVKSDFKSRFSPVTNFFGRLVASARMMNQKEKALTYLLTVVAVVLLVVRGNQLYVANTVSVPALGGSYKEELVGDVKYLNPVLAKSDAERSISELIYDGLIKINPNGEVSPELAKDWNVSDDGLTYTFNLRDNVSFANGQLFDSGDVVATINLIKDPSVKSTFLDEWKDVQVSTPDPNVVTFTLPRPYGPFIYQCSQGIISKDDINSSLVDNFDGSGAYKFLKSVSIENGDAKRITLSANQNYFAGSSFIKGITFDVFPDLKLSKAVNLINNYTATTGFANGNRDFSNMDFETQRQLSLIANLRQPNMANQDIRKRVMQLSPDDQKVTVKLLALDAKAQHDAVLDLTKKASDANIEIDANFVQAADYQESILKRDYDLILYGFNYGYDRDPYVYWHSSQSDAMNLAGYKDKASDILLEDARMMTDSVARNAKYDQFFESAKSQNLIVFFPLSKYNYSVRSDVKGIDQIHAFKPQDRFAGILKWYITERRVKK